MSDLDSDLIIKGVTLAGRPFRPSDWAERLCGVMSAFGQDERLRYSPHVQPVLHDGVRSVRIGKALAQLEPRLHKFFISFAVDNELQVAYDADATATLLPEYARLLAREAPPPAPPPPVRPPEDY